MTIEQERKMLEAAAKACGLTITWAINADGSTSGPWIGNSRWNSRDNPADTAEMCAKLDINTYWHINEVECSTSQNIVTSHSEQHNGTDAGKESAQRLAATIVAAKIGGYTDEL